ncbi:MAG: sn-glycerol-3-phosphate ABC transporter ATP-binding protein UgpC [Microbacterium sp.]|jgi:multiple sugar transport system ATP-binding protein|nr:sn-glycerol-3-phosphate ABC transporter ATP-binding protein UgpC [Microbacterium sp.]
MAGVTLEQVSKIYPPSVTAVEPLDLEIADGEFVVLVGPSGCGKTTLLRMIAGLEAVTTGRVLVGARDVTRVAPQARDIAMVFQSYALYPQMTVRENLAFPLKTRRVRRAEIAERVEAVARTLDIAELLDRKPGQLSGGQRQRVAIGRATIRQPQVFLMDEPLSNLDAKLRVEMRAELARLHLRLGTTTIYVTHDQVEAMTLGQRVVVMRGGALQQCDTPRALFGTPENLFVATFIGSPTMNLVDAELADGAVSFGGLSVIVDGWKSLGSEPRPVILGIRPAAFGVPGPGADPTLPRLRVIPDVVEELGTETHVLFSMEGCASAFGPALLNGSAPRSSGLARFTAVVDGTNAINRGAPLELIIRREHLHIFDPHTGAALRR